MQVLIGKLANLTEKSKQELIIRFNGEIASELLKRVTYQLRIHLQERFPGKDFKKFLEG